MSGVTPSWPNGGAGATYTVLASAPSGRCMAKVNQFIVIGCLSTDPFAIQWSAIGDGTDWPTPATDDARAKQSGKQTLSTKHGYVTEIIGNDFYGYVFQERAITKMTYVGGDVVFAFDTFEEDRGCERTGKAVAVDDKVFFKSTQGYHMLENDQIANIGYGIVDDTY
jgi:hypothetical protein